MSEALDKIQADAKEFFDGVDRVEGSTTFNGADVKDAYARFSRLLERYWHEKKSKHFTPVEEQALRKVFEDDVFMKGMLDACQIAEHIQKRSGGGPVIRTMDNSPIPLSAKTSAASFFAEAVFTVRGDQGKTHNINHLQQLKEAKRRVCKALELAQKS
jgi:hypothetical protein